MLTRKNVRIGDRKGEGDGGGGSQKTGVRSELALGEKGQRGMRENMELNKKLEINRDKGRLIGSNSNTG